MMVTVDAIVPLSVALLRGCVVKYESVFVDETSQQLLALVERAVSEVTVLLQGATGSVKSIGATCPRLLPRRDGPLQNCAALPENLAESLLFAMRGAFTALRVPRTDFSPKLRRHFVLR